VTVLPSFRTLGLLLTRQVSQDVFGILHALARLSYRGVGPPSQGLLIFFIAPCLQGLGLRVAHSHSSAGSSELRSFPTTGATDGVQAKTISRRSLRETAFVKGPLF
jgi:hypothetical protein